MTLSTSLSSKINLSSTILKSTSNIKIWQYFSSIFLDLQKLAQQIQANEKTYLTGGCPILSMKDSEDLKLCFQNIVAFIVYPNLLENVGVPFEVRSKSLGSVTVLDEDGDKSSSSSSLSNPNLQTKENIHKCQKLDIVYDIFTTFQNLSETSNLIHDHFTIDIATILIQNLAVAANIILNPGLETSSTTGQKLDKYLEKAGSNFVILKNFVKGLLQLLNLEKSQQFVKVLAGRIMSQILNITSKDDGQENSRGTNYPTGLTSIITSVIGDLSVVDYGHPDV